MSHTIKQVTQMSDDEFLPIYDNQVQGAFVSGEFYHGEYLRRIQDKQTKTIIRYTKYVAWMTYVITLATIANLIIAYEVLRR